MTMIQKRDPYPEGSLWAALKKITNKVPLEERRKAAATLPKEYQALLDLETEYLTEETIVYIDMDDTICRLQPALDEARKRDPDTRFPQGVPGFFENLDPIPGAIRAVNQLRSRADVYILTAPSVRNAHCYTEKRLWIEKHFDLDFCDKLIICPNKALLKGDIIIDDYNEGRGQENFEGRLIHFGSADYPGWDSVLKELEVS